MALIDLSLTIPGPPSPKAAAAVVERRIGNDDASYTAVTYRFAHDSMVGTYIDFPGHIKETHDGMHADNYPLAKLANLDAVVIHLDRADGSGPVSAEELAAACPEGPPAQAIIINALGKRRFDDIVERSVYLTTDAVQWIVESGAHLLVSDIYESKALHGVFFNLFAGGVSAVCYPVNLHLLTADRVRLWAIAARYSNVTQLTCRLFAEMPHA
ncbi:MAG: cyclase family protein [Planctomycetes bacterium]|nr:cyclase family protein [Planctomycetota bacterium]